MADGDQLWSVWKLENDLLRRNASTNGRKTDLIESYILQTGPSRLLLTNRVTLQAVNYGKSHHEKVNT
jgi:hypothetical protein